MGIFIILIILFLFFFGVKILPKLGRLLGRGVGKFEKGMHDSPKAIRMPLPLNKSTIKLSKDDFPKVTPMPPPLKGAYKGRGLAMAGVIIGVCVLIFFWLASMLTDNPVPSYNSNSASPAGAAEQGDRANVEQYLQNGVDVNARDNEDQTPLMKAVRGGRLDVVKYLVAKGADVNARDNNGTTPLMKAASAGNLDVVTFLVDKGAYVNAKDEDGYTALTNYAADIAIKKLLIQHGARWYHVHCSLCPVGCTRMYDDPDDLL